MCLLLKLLLGSVLAIASGSSSKTWIPDTNYWSLQNWNVERLPCQNDRVIFPALLEAAIYLHPGSTAAKEFVLPYTGELILAPGQLLITEFSELAESGCPGQDVVFVGGQEKAWLDPRNWKDSHRNKWQDFSDSPIPHAERVPCPTDQVIFPEESSFKIKLPDVPVTIGKIFVDGKSISSNQLEATINTDTGYHLFKGDPFNIMITDNVCNDPVGCVCKARHYTQAMEIICSYESNRCGDPRCERPVQPIGHCCKLCGSVLTLYVDVKKFTQSALTRKLAKYSKVLSYASRVDDHYVQLILMEKNHYTVSADDLAQQLADYLIEDDQYGVYGIEIQSSGKPQASMGNIGKILLTIFFLGLACAIIGLAVFGYQRFRSGDPLPYIPSFHFRRFENDGELEISKDPNCGTDAKGSVSSFDNPVYGLPSTSSGRNISATQPKQQLSLSLESTSFKTLQASLEGRGEYDEENTDLTM